MLVVEDEDHLAELYTEHLSERYEVRTAYGGMEAREMLSADLEVVLLDRRMPVVSGNEVLAEIEERGLQCRIAMVTDEDPDFDIIDMGCDDYIVKPVTRDALLTVVDRLMKVTEYDERMEELTDKKLKRNVLQIEKSADELEESSEFEQLERDIDTIEEDIQTLADDLGTEYVPREL